MKQKGKIVIGVTGTNGSGKDTVCDLIADNFEAKKLVYSKLLEDALKIFIEDIGREDYSWLSTNLRERYGEGIIGKGMERKIAESKPKIVVLSGVRDMGELDLIRKYDNGFLIYVDADVKVRWQRIKNRKYKSDDAVDFNEFVKKKEKLPSEKRIKDLKVKADFVINNEKGKSELWEQVENVVKKIINKSQNE